MYTFDKFRFYKHFLMIILELDV